MDPVKGNQCQNSWWQTNLQSCIFRKNWFKTFLGVRDKLISLVHSFHAGEIEGKS